MAIMRNASEALEIVQMGMDLKAGDEVSTTNQDYPPDDHRLGTAGCGARELFLERIPFPGARPAVAGRSG
jgi:hypothetical protein